MDLLQAFRPVLSAFCAIAPGRNQLTKPGAFVFFVFNNQYLFLSHSWIAAA